MEYSEYFMMLLGVTNLLLGGLLWRFISHQRHNKLFFEQKIKLLNDDVRALCAGAAGVAGHLNKIEQKVKRVLERQDQLDTRDPADRAFNQATRMARQGATVNELISTCGLVRAEAELLALLHRAQEDDNRDSQLRVVSG